MTPILHRAGLALLSMSLVWTTPAPAQEALRAEIAVAADRPGPTYNRQIFGQFAEHLGHGIYGGIWVGEGSRIPNDHGYRLDVLDALRAIKVPVVRWPGGCFADEYHWREGIGPRAKRPVKVNTNWGGVTEDNAFGTHEFMGFVERLGAEAYVSGNVGNAPPREMAEWIEYMTSPTGSTLAKERAANGRAAPWTIRYLGLGNELWGCGGSMRADYAADVTNRYATFAKAGSGGMMKIASGASDQDYNWTDAMMRIAGNQIDGLSLHYYTVPGTWARKGAATGFDEHQWAEVLAKTMKMEELIAGHSAVMDKYDPGKKKWLVVDEWGTWYAPEPGSNPGFLVQQNTLRDALVAAVNLNIFAHHADRVKMAAIAQMVNVLQAMLFTDGARMVRTPTYWVYDLYQPWQDATVLPVDLTSPQYRKDEFAMPAISASAVRDKAGRVHLALANLDPNRPATVSIALAGVTPTRAQGRMIAAATMDAHNSFQAPDAVRPIAFTGAQVSGGRISATLPAKSLVVLALD